MQNKKIRISKIISHSGICSRREAEILIKKGEVKINGKIFKEFSVNKDHIKNISLFGKELKKKETQVWCFYKPVGYVSSNKEQKNQKSLFRLMPIGMPRVVSVGRLDIDSEGLMILTNNPALSDFLEKPINSIKRVYDVEVSGMLPENLEKKTTNLKIDDIYYKKLSIIKIESNDLDHKLRIEIFEGKNREIRNVMDYFGLKVLKLKRIEYGPFKLGLLNEGKTQQIKRLDDKLKNLNFKDANNFW